MLRNTYVVEIARDDFNSKNTFGAQAYLIFRVVNCKISQNLEQFWQDVSTTSVLRRSNFRLVRYWISW